MAITHSPNLNLPIPDGAELVQLGPSDFEGIVNVLDAGSNGPTAARMQKGVLGSLPAQPQPLGSIYHCTNASAAFYSDGAAWHMIPTNQPTIPIGSIQGYAGASDPTDPDGVGRWVIANGRNGFSAGSHPALNALMNAAGYPYGGNSSNFNIPNLQQRVPLGKAASGTGSTLGGAGGAIDHTHGAGGIYTPSYHMDYPIDNHVHILSGNGAAMLHMDNQFIGSGWITGAGEIGSPLAFTALRHWYWTGVVNMSDWTSQPPLSATPLMGNTDGFTAQPYARGDTGDRGAAGTSAGGNPPYLTINYIIKTA